MYPEGPLGISRVRDEEQGAWGLPCAHLRKLSGDQGSALLPSKASW